MATSKRIRIQFFASLRESVGMSEIELETQAETPAELYSELSTKYELGLREDQLKVAINEEFVGMNQELNGNDTVVFIPPVAGG